MRPVILPLFACLAACADPSRVIVELSPPVISSLDGTTEVSALVADDGGTPLADQSVKMTVTYADRLGTSHDVPSVDGHTDARGVFHATLADLSWDGTGTVAIEVSPDVTGSATFAVLDRTPPHVEILPPTTDLRVGAGLPLDVQVKVTDEIGVGNLTLDATGAIGGARSTIIADAAADTTVTFHMSIAANATAGPTITLYALATDLSGNAGAAASVTLTVDPTITIATPPGLTGSLLVDGTAQQLANPRSIAVSSKDGHLYIADQAGTGACSPSCIWRVNATSGAIDPTPVIVGAGAIEGVALDATADNLYYSDRQNRIGRLTWNGTAYATGVLCNDTNQQQPQDPYHLVVDPTLGVLVVDDNQRDVVRVATCATSTVGTTFTMNANFDTPRGIAAGAAGEFYVSDQGRDRISKVDGTGAITTFEGGVAEPYGMEWYAGATAPWAGSLMVAAGADRTIVSTRGHGALAAAYLRNAPVDLSIATGTMFIVTSPSAGNRGRVYSVTGF